MQLCGIIYYSIVPWLLYMFRAIISLIIRRILTVITASGFIHMYNYTSLPCFIFIVKSGLHTNMAAKFIL